MNDFPFGFGVPPSGDDEPEHGKDPGKHPSSEGGGSGGSGRAKDPGEGQNPFNDPNNPFAALFGGMQQVDLAAAFQQIGRLLSFQGGPVNWEFAHDIARQTVSAGSDRSVGGKERAEIEEAVRLAEHWLDPATALPAGTTGALAWSRAEWVEATLPAWKQLVEPVAEKVVAAMGQALPGEIQAMAGPLLGMMRSMGGAMFGMQIGQALGTLAGEVLGATDVGLPLGPAGKAALLPSNIEAFGEGLEIPADQVRLYLALREVAYHRLFAHVPWLRSHLFSVVEAYAGEIRIDTDRLEEKLSGFDPTNPAALQEALEGGLFQPEQTPGQKAALSRLETLLALIEGWVDAVVDAAATPHLPAAAALRETLRRRRATGGPAEQTFAALVGLELRPRRLRDAARLWSALVEARGVDGRDDCWDHPDLLPTADDLDDPDGFVHRTDLDLSGLEDLGQAPQETTGQTGQEGPGTQRPDKEDPDMPEDPGAGR